MYRIDARHFFHNLRLGRRWAKRLAHPPIKGRAGELLFPLHLAVPMGFTAAATFAQRANDKTTSDADLPPDRRLIDNLVVPSGLPIWGSILDDVLGL